MTMQLTGPNAQESAHEQPEQAPGLGAFFDSAFAAIAKAKTAQRIIDRHKERLAQASTDNGGLQLVADNDNPLVVEARLQLIDNTSVLRTASDALIDGLREEYPDDTFNIAGSRYGWLHSSNPNLQPALVRQPRDEDRIVYYGLEAAPEGAQAAQLDDFIALIQETALLRGYQKRT